jgi:hypothetical protein
MPRSPSISVCNIALSEVRASTIVSIDEDSAEAKACAVHYDDCLQLLMETHDWGFARVRANLASLAVNDRPGNWLYAYAIPEDMANATALVWPQQTPLSGVYYPWPYLYPRPPFVFSDYVIAGETIYSNVSGAVIEYVSRNIEEARMPSMFKRALALELASRLAITLLNDRALKGDLIQQAEAAKRRAMAEDLNSYPHRDRAVVDEVALVRLR